MILAVCMRHRSGVATIRTIVDWGLYWGPSPVETTIECHTYPDQSTCIHSPALPQSAVKPASTPKPQTLM